LALKLSIIRCISFQGIKKRDRVLANISIDVSNSAGIISSAPYSFRIDISEMKGVLTIK